MFFRSSSITANIEIDEEVIERRFICDYWRFLKVMAEVLNFEFLDRNTIRYETIEELFKPAEEVKIPIAEIIANPIDYFNSDQIKQIAVWHELQKLDK